MNKKNGLLVGLVALCAACTGTGERSNDTEKIRQIIEEDAAESPNRTVIKLTNEVKTDYQAGDTIWFGDLRILIDRVEAKKINEKKDQTARLFAALQGKGQKESWNIYCELLNTSEKDTMVVPYVFYQKPKKKNTIRVSSQPSADLLEFMGMRFIMDVSKKEPSLVTSCKIPPGQKRQWMYITYNQVDTEVMRLSYGGREDNTAITFDKEASDNPMFEMLAKKVMLSSKESVKLPAGYVDKNVTVNLKDKLVRMDEASETEEEE